jgi:hypothetical protein
MGGKRVRDLLLNDPFVQVVTMLDARTSIEVVGGSREDALPAPLAVGVRVLSEEGVRQRRPAQPTLQIGFVLLADVPQVVVERLVRHGRQPLGLTSPHDSFDAVQRLF